MADDPADPPTMRQTRARTQPGGNRDELSERARADRALLVPEFVSEDVTGQVMAMSDEQVVAYAVADDPAEARAEMIAELRDTRSPKTRIRHLEKKVDKIVPTLARIEGVISVLPGHVQDAAAAAREAAAAANAVASAHRIATVTATVETDGATTIGKIETATAEKIDTIEKRKSRRELIVAAIGLVASGGIIAEIVHVIMERLL